VGQGGRKDQCSNTRDQAEEEDNTNHITCQRDVGHEDIASRAN
jgi:hypothetical protein